MSETPDRESTNHEAALAHIKANGVSGIDEFFKTKLEEWKNAEINIAVTGFSGVGKSSFINAIRGLKDDEELAAETGIIETTRDVAVYPHPNNDKINFWDLPGIGTPKFPDLETYCKGVGLEKYDTFLILTATRFSQNDLDLAKKVKSINKSFFFIRTKIDQDYANEKRKKGFNEKAMLKTMMDDCSENLEGFQDNDKVDVFLISNRRPTMWDFDRLTQAILDVLPQRQKECFTLSLDLLTSLSEDILRRKVEILRGRILMVASASAVSAAVPLPGLSVVVDIVLTSREVNLYKTQLGLIDKNFSKSMTPEMNEKIRELGLVTVTQWTSLIASYASSSKDFLKEFIRSVPLGSTFAAVYSFATNYYFLQSCLDEFEKMALSTLYEMKEKTLEGFDN